MFDDNPFGFGPEKTKRDSRRAFNRTQKNEIWAQQNGKCAKCKSRLDPRHTQYDHGRAWSDGGKTTVKNGKALCANCHSVKTHKDRLKKVDKKKKKKDDNPLTSSIFGSSGGRRKGPFDF